MKYGLSVFLFVVASVTLPDYASAQEETDSSTDVQGESASETTVPESTEDPTPQEAEPPMRTPGRGLRIAGWVTLGVGYFFSAALGIFYILAESENTGFMYIPLVGSAIVGVKTLRDVNDVDWSSEVVRFWGVFLFLPSIVQATGLTLAIIGHARGASAKQDSAMSSRSNFELSLLPSGPSGEPGLTLSGRF